MATGPVQLLVLGFRQPGFQGEIRAKPDRLRRTNRKEEHILGPSRGVARRTARRTVGAAPVAAAAVVAAPTAGRRVSRRTARRVARRRF